MTDTARHGEELERGRNAYARRDWLDAHGSLSRADVDARLDAEDVHLLATAAYMLGRDEESMALLERAHHDHLAAGQTLRAVRAALWLGLHHALRGQIAAAGGWLARAQRLLDREAAECAERGYLLLPAVFRHEAAGEFAAAAAVAAEAAEIGERFDDRELFALALQGQGYMLIQDGRVVDGLARLDEAMLAVTTEELSPHVTGIVYCGSILACRDVFEARRAREWTSALSAWWEQQPDMIAFTGRCLLHRAEILQLGGSWPVALDEARQAGKRFLETKNSAAGLAHYRQGELLRLLGEFAAAEAAYREASRLGWEPQPGLAQLRQAQGRLDTAVAAIRRACGEVVHPLKRAVLLPAYVEIMLAAGEQDEATAACRELEQIAQRYDSAMLGAIVAYELGAVTLADGDAQAALVALREAWRAWHELDAPYEVARARVLVGRACRALGDEEAATLELEAARGIFADLGARPDLEALDRDGRDPAATHGLSKRELEVLRLVAAGRSNREIASALVISEHTVARHVQNIYGKLHLSSRTAATAFAFEHDLV